MNLPQFMVSDAHNLCARDPDILVPPRDEKSENKALKNRKAYVGIYEASGGNWLMQESSYAEILHGWGVLGALPNLKKNRVELVSYAAPYCYPVFELGSQMFMRELFVLWQATPATVKAAYPNFEYDGGSSEESRFLPGNAAQKGEGVNVLIYYGKDSKMVFANDQFVSGIRHDWGFVPFTVVPFQQAPGTLGMGIADQAYGITMAVNKQLSLLYQTLHENVNSDTVVYSDDDFDVTDRHGRKVWQMSRDSKMEKATDDVGRVVEGTRMIHDLLSMAGMMGGSSAARQGQREGMYISAAYSELSKGLGDKLDNYLRVKGERMATAFEYAARLAEKHFANTKMELGGKIDGSPFQINFKGKDFDKYYRVDVTWPPAVMNSANNWLVNWLQINKSQLASNHTTRTKLGGLIQDPEFEKKQIEEETFEKAKLDAAATAILMSVQNQMALQQQQQLQSMQQQLPSQESTNPDEIPAQKEQLEKGRTNETAEGLFSGGVQGQLPPVPQVGNAGMGGGTGGMPLQVLPGGAGVQPGEAGSPMPVVPPEASQPMTSTENVVPLEVLLEELRSVGKVKGSVYLVGEAVAIGSINAESMVELAITEPLDKQTFINALPQYKGRLNFIPTDTMPSEPHVHVFDDGVPSDDDRVMGEGGGYAVPENKIGEEPGQIQKPLGENPDLLANTGYPS